jgi:hypothetical protein
LNTWLKLRPSFLDRSNRLKVTIFGPYGEYLPRLKKITKFLREKHGFSNTFLVLERNFKPKLTNETRNVYLKNKSYHYLETSHVNIFVFYCYAYNESPSIELKHVCDKLPKKIECCAVIKDKSCKMSPLLGGEIDEALGLVSRVEEFYSSRPSSDEYIIELVKAKCINFLKVKFNEI